jgi:chromosome segregation ATPase
VDTASGNSVAMPAPGMDQILLALNQLAQSIHRVEQAQTQLRQQQTDNTASLQKRLGEVETSIRQRLDALEQDQDVLRQDVGAMSVKMEEMEEENKMLKDSLQSMEQKLDQAENQSKRNNLLFHGIPRTPKESWSDCEEKVKKVIREDMKVTQDISIERAHRVGRAIIIKLLSYKDKETVLRGAKNLASTNNSISVSEDFSKTVQQKRKGLIPMMKALRADQHRAKLRFDKLVTDDGVYTFDLSTQEVLKLDSAVKGQHTGASEQQMDAAPLEQEGDVWG